MTWSPEGGNKTHSNPVPAPPWLLLQMGLATLSFLHVVTEEEQSRQ